MIKRLKRIYRELFPQPKTGPVAFALAGTTPFEKGMSKELFDNNQTYKQAFIECNNIVEEISSLSLYPLLNSEIEPDDKCPEFMKTAYMIAVQIGVSKVIMESGYTPDVFAGSCGGELVGLYFAECIDLKALFVISMYFAAFNPIDNLLYGYYTAYTDASTFKAAQKKFSIWIDFFYEKDSKELILVTYISDRETVEKELKKAGIDFRFAKTSRQCYHSKFERNNYNVYKTAFEQIIFRPTQYDTFSSITGQLVPKHTLPRSDYFIDIISNPVMMYSQLKATCHHGANLIVQVGVDILNENMISELNTSEHAIEVVSTMKKGISEVVCLNNAIRMLSALPKKDGTAQSNAQNALNGFLQNFNIYGPDTIDALKYLRTMGGVHFLPLMQGWIVLNYDAIDQILRDDETYSVANYTAIDTVLLGSSGVAHSKSKNILKDFFSSSQLKRIEEDADVITRGIFGKLKTCEKFDIVTDFAQPLIHEVLCNFFGMIPEDREQFRSTFLSGKEMEWQELFSRLNDFFILCVEDPKYAETNGMISGITSLISNSVFTKEEGVGILRLFWAAGVETTIGLVSIVFNNLFRHKTLWPTLIGDDKKCAKFLEECLRLEATSRVVRITTKEVAIEGKTIPAGSPILINLQSANTDPTHYENPLLFSIERPTKKNMAFGAGTHLCIGMGMAKTIGKTVLNCVLAEHEAFVQFDSKRPVYHPIANFSDQVLSIPVDRNLPLKVVAH